jgi:hypothetical protein
MKSLDGDMDVLSGELERLDYVVVKHGDYFCVRLPLLTSVEVHHTPERGFRFIPQVGPFKRSAGLFFTSGVAAAAVTASALEFGPAPVTLIVAFLGIVALAHDACRFVLTEGCLTRLQQLISSRFVAKAPATGPIPALGESAPYTFFDQRAPADRTSVSR